MKFPTLNFIRLPFKGETKEKKYISDFLTLSKATSTKMEYRNHGAKSTATQRRGF